MFASNNWKIEFYSFILKRIVQLRTFINSWQGFSDESQSGNISVYVYL